MKWKQDPADFRVHERLREGYVRSSGPWRVYRVTKRKLTSLEAASALAELVGVAAGDVHMAGLKDRQGVTVQFMSVRGGKPLRLRTPELSIEPAGSAAHAISPDESEGNSFRIRLRELGEEDLARIRRSTSLVRSQGLPNYFDEQRFGNLRHGQGWIARDLMLGRHEAALKAFLSAPSERDDARHRQFKGALAKAWGDWAACRDVAGRFGEHHSIFEHLRRSPHDFAGAFTHVAARLRLIHLYAFQSHVWNRAVARYVAGLCGTRGAGVWSSIEGPLVFPLAPIELDPAMNGSFRLPGAGLADVEHPSQRELFEDVLAGEGLVPDQFRIEGVSGFALKGEERALLVRPEHLRARVPEREGAAPGRASALLAFDLPRGAYATLVVRALLARPLRGAVDLARLERSERSRPRAQHRPDERGATERRRPAREDEPPAADARARHPRPARGRERAHRRGRRPPPPESP